MYANDTAYTEGSIANVEAYINDMLIGRGGSDTENPGAGETEDPTESQYPTVEETLKEGDYIEYVDGTGETRRCVVLYGPENSNYADYGIQIISMEPMGEVTLGSDDYATSLASYNNAITTLNGATDKYVNSQYATSSRCVGSVPNDRDYDAAGMYTTSSGYLASYSGKMKNTDTNYLTDWNQMIALGICDLESEETYWLCSRYIYYETELTYLAVRYAWDRSRSK